VYAATRDVLARCVRPLVAASCVRLIFFFKRGEQMEPTETWVEMFYAAKEGEWQKAVECAVAIRRELADGGAPPIITGVCDFDRIVARAACETIVAWERR
jgi:hypothetical protein